VDDLRLHELLEKDLEGRLADGERDELLGALRASAQARECYWDVVEQHVLIGAVLSENRGFDLARLEEGTSAAVAAEPMPAKANSRAGRRWIVTTGLAIVIAASCLLIALPWGERSDGPASLATVGVVAGDIEVSNQAGKSIAAVPGTKLFEGDVLRVGDEESRVEVAFADGTQITVPSGSTLRFVPADSKDGKHIHLENGAVRVQVIGKPKDDPFVVTTEHAKITGLATRFRVYREEKGSRLELEEGQAHLESRAGANAIDVAEGSFVVATSDAAPMVPQRLAETHCRLRHTFPRAGDAVAFSPDSSRFVTSHFGRAGLKARSTLDGAVIGSAPGVKHRMHGMAFTTDDAIAAIASDGTAILWKIDEPQTIQTRLRDKDLRQAAISDNGRWIAQGTGRGEVSIWEINAEACGISHRHSLPIKPSRVAVSNVGPHVAISSWGGEIQAFDLTNGREVSKLKLTRTPTPLALSADNRYVAAYSNGDGLVLFDQLDGSRKTLWAVQGGRVAHLAFTNDGQMLLAGMDDGMVRGWSTNDGQSLLVLETGCRHVNRVTMSADQTLLATVGEDDCVKIWEFKAP